MSAPDREERVVTLSAVGAAVAWRLTRIVSAQSAPAMGAEGARLRLHVRGPTVRARAGGRLRGAAWGEVEVPERVLVEIAQALLRALATGEVALAPVIGESVRLDPVVLTSWLAATEAPSPVRIAGEVARHRGLEAVVAAGAAREALEQGGDPLEVAVRIALRHALRRRRAPGGAPPVGPASPSVVPATSGAADTSTVADESTAGLLTDATLDERVARVADALRATFGNEHGEVDHASAWEWLLDARSRHLGGQSPLEALRDGDDDRVRQVLAAARGDVCL